MNGDALRLCGVMRWGSLPAYDCLRFKRSRAKGVGMSRHTHEQIRRKVTERARALGILVALLLAMPVAGLLAQRLLAQTQSAAAGQATGGESKPGEGVGDTLSPWTPGTLEIHQISTG
ncbi:MAG: hypothetical protein ACRD5L_01375, partial [Bryobacteraceae bacterium]